MWLFRFFASWLSRRPGYFWEELRSSPWWGTRGCLLPSSISSSWLHAPGRIPELGQCWLFAQKCTMGHFLFSNGSYCDSFLHSAHTSRSHRWNRLMLLSSANQPGCGVRKWEPMTRESVLETRQYGLGGPFLLETLCWVWTWWGEHQNIFTLRITESHTVDELLSRFKVKLCVCVSVWFSKPQICRCLTAVVRSQHLFYLFLYSVSTFWCACQFGWTQSEGPRLGLGIHRIFGHRNFSPKDLKKDPWIENCKNL